MEPNKKRAYIIIREEDDGKMNCLSVFDYFVGLAFKGLTHL